MIIQRYILKQIAVPFVLICILLAILLLAEAFGDVLTRALGGTLPGNAVAMLMLYQLPLVLQELMPGGFFLALVIALGQMSGSNERVVLQATGYSDAKIMRLILLVGVLATALLYLFTLYLVPLASRTTEMLNKTLAERPAAEIVQPGQFTSIDRDGSVLYAQSSDPAAGSLLSVFMAFLEEGEQRLLTADSAQVINDGEGRYLVFSNGELLTGFDDEQLERTQFSQMSLLLERREVSDSFNRRSRTNQELWESGTRRNIATLQWRLLYPLSLLVFCIWAVNLTRYKPRSGKNAAVLPAVIFYVVYQYLCRTVNASVGSGNLPLWLNFWWIHVIGVALGFALRIDFADLKTRLRNAVPSRGSASRGSTS
ncbi:LPS export ABC transporter permease LptF [Salinispirillum sp. LH 10-3-1]|uniref:Lipopolysaccharide export system permease protein LptF n=1 Tax=Salinispirillum sp. LH 10-3-1 TaxID=2952525 RepID=A0AB38YJK1_9GAMM